MALAASNFCISVSKLVTNPDTGAIEEETQAELSFEKIKQSLLDDQPFKDAFAALLGTGPQGPQGPAGPAGPAGPEGPAGNSPTPQSVASELTSDTSFVSSLSTELAGSSSLVTDINHQTFVVQ